MAAGMRSLDIAYLYENMFKKVMMSYIRDLVIKFFFTCFNLDMVSEFHQLLHARTELKSIFLDFVCRKVLPFTNKNPLLPPYSGDVWP